MKKIFILSVLSIMIMSCDSMKTPKVERTKIYPTETVTEKIAFPVKLHYVTKNGMDYMISSGISGESGTSIVNLTLDSLQVEYYKQELNK